MRSRTAFVLLLSLCFWTPPSGGAQDAQAPADLDALLQGFRGMSGLSAKFREEKSVALLAVPIRSEGEIHFAQPGLLVRQVTAPVVSTALIARGRLVMVSGGRRQEIDLSGNPVVSGFVDSFRHVLAGDRAALERPYRVRLTSDGAEWSLELRPRRAPPDHVLTRLGPVSYTPLTMP